MGYVAYYRVSTAKQGSSGLGLDSQKSIVRNYISPDKLDFEFTEIESGKKNNRPILIEAIQKCKENNHTLIIAKLDRLSRNVSFVSALMDSGIKFICCDMPHANELTIHIISAIAENERKLISERTKGALAEKKKQGYKLGTPNLTMQDRLNGCQANIDRARKNENNKRAIAYLSALPKDMKLKDKTDLLNKNGFKTSKGFMFSPMQTKRLLDHLKQFIVD